MGENEVRESIRRSLDLLASSEPSRSEFGRKVGVTAQNVSHWLNGGVTPPIEKLVEIAEVYGVSLDTLVGRPQRSGLMPDEAQLVELLRSMAPQGRALVLEVAQRFKDSGAYDA